MNCFNMHILLELTYLFKRCNVVCVFEIQFCKCRECLCMLYRVSLTVSRLCLLAPRSDFTLSQQSTKE